MGIFDRLKPQPRWKHSDPVVRLQAVPELEDAIELAALAESDPDAKVRTAALAKVVDPVVLGRVTNADTDQGVRDAAADRLLALALDPSNAGAATAAGFLSDVRRVTVIAKSTASDSVREIALAGLTEERALGGVARHAKMESTALAAAARLGTADELLATALNSEHRDVALGAFDRVMAARPNLDADVAFLKSVEARAQQKAVVRRARAMLQAIEDAETARRVAEEEKQKKEAALCAAVHHLATLDDPDRIEADLAHMTATWAALASTDAAIVQWFAAGADAARLRIAQRRSEIAAAREEARRRSEGLGKREELCRRITAIQGEAALEQLGSVEKEWAQLPALAGYEREVGQLAAQFAAAAKACRERVARNAELAQARGSLEALVLEAESLSTQETDGAPDRWRALWHGAGELSAMLEEASRPATDLRERLAVVSQALAARETAAREAAAKAKADRFAKLARLVDRAQRTADADTVTVREGERLLLDIATAVEQVARDEGTEVSKEIGDALAKLRTLRGRIERRVKELRDLDVWRRFANGEQQERLIAMAEAIVASLQAEEAAGTASDLATTAKALRELHAEWQKVAHAPQDSAQLLWSRFKTATDFIRSRCEIHFAQVKEERSRNLAAKVAILAQAEELAESTDWNRTAAQFQELQAAWEQSGLASDESTRSLARRFRAACSTFFTRRRDALISRKQEWADNLARKETLCERAEQLAESTEWDSAAAELKKMQAEWKTIGPVRRDRNEAVWTRFRTAADKFFDRYGNRHRIAVAGQLAEIETLVVALESLVAFDDAPEDLAAQVQTLRTTISNAPQVDGAAATALHQRWMAALAALVSRWPAAFAGTDLDPVATRQRMQRLLAKVESLAAKEAPVAAPNQSAAELLAERLRAALASNALGARPDETKWRTAGRTVEEAQDAWSRLLRLPGEETDALEDRFRTACRQVMAQVRKHVGSSGGSEAEFAGGNRKSPPRRAKHSGSRG